MSLLSVAYTTNPTVERVIRRDLLARFLDDTGLGVTGTVSSGSATTMVDATDLLSAQYRTTDWTNGWMRISYDAGGAGAAPEGTVRTISAYAPGTGTVTVATMTAPAVGDKYELWKFPNPNLVLRNLDDILKNDIYLPTWSVLSEVPDFDMEQSGTTDWTASNATVTKQTADPTMGGKRYLRVVATAANGYARPPLFNVEPLETYHLSAIARAGDTATTARLVLYDETNGAAITPQGASTLDSARLYPARLWGSFIAPAGCHQVSIRLTTVQNAKTTEWDDVIFYAHQSQSIALPWWVRNKSQVLGVFRMHPWSQEQNLWVNELTGEQTDQFDIQDSAFGRGQLRLVARREAIHQYPLYIFGKRNETAFSDDNTDAKHIDIGHVVAALAERTFTQLSGLPEAGGLDVGWLGMKLDEWQRKHRATTIEQDERLSHVIQSPNSDMVIRADHGW